MNNRNFLVSALVDFPDDCISIEFNQEILSDMIRKLHWMGANRIYWNFYQQGMWEVFSNNNQFISNSLLNLGDPINLGVKLAHDLGMEFFATIKPYEAGCSHTLPVYSNDETKPTVLPGIAGNYLVDSWVKNRPEMRVKCREYGLSPSSMDSSIGHIQLRQKDELPIRITENNIEIWTSHNNNSYQKINVEFTLKHSTRISDQDVFDMDGNLVTSVGTPCSVIDIYGLNLKAPFIAITTDIEDSNGTFSNTAFEMVKVFDINENPLPIIVGSHKALWRPQRNFRTGDLEYDNGLGNQIVHLDVSNKNPITVSSSSLQDQQTGDTLNMDGVIAFATGRQNFLSGSLCEGYSEVREYWKSWVEKCVNSKVDGIDVRISNHSGWTNTPDLYGFNEPIVKEYKNLYGVNPSTSRFDPVKLGNIRGLFFDQFLMDIRKFLTKNGKKLSVNLEPESFRSDACQSRWRTRPGNIIFNWQKWITSGIADEATLLCRGWDVAKILNDKVAGNMLKHANNMNIPVHLSKQVGHGAGEPEKLQASYDDQRLSGYCYYETATMVDTHNPISDKGLLNFKPGLLESIKTQIDLLKISNKSQ